MAHSALGVIFPIKDKTQIKKKMTIEKLSESGLGQLTLYSRQKKLIYALFQKKKLIYVLFQTKDICKSDRRR